MPVDEKSDATGLGLGDFLAGKKSDAVPASPAASEPEKPAVPADTKPATPAPADKKPDSKPVDAKSAKPVAKADGKPADAAVAPDAKPNWDDDTNPWKQKANDFDKRFRDTQRSRSELEQQIAEERRQRIILTKKLEGTYDPRVDEPAPPDPQAIRQWGEIEGKAQTSLAVAYRQHGKDKVNQVMEKYGKIFGQDRAVQERILMSDDPIQSAMDAVASFEFFEQYGANPSAIVESIRKQVEAELAPKIAEREAKRIQGELASNKSEPRGIGRVQGSSGATDKSVSKENAGRARPLEAIFGR